MIQATEANVKYDVCSSCGTRDAVKQIKISRSADANASVVTLCAGCIAEVAFQTGVL